MSDEAGLVAGLAEAVKLVQTADLLELVAHVALERRHDLGQSNPFPHTLIELVRVASHGQIEGAARVLQDIDLYTRHQVR